ncbi:MAG: LysR family transcriptional regulator [Alphaproteobacteria bacterium]|nr:LysR family transcriptional regulator [Alphaproteobacteria bacterium]MDE1985639.1 LysR family transcriptional regulator [Alphaproteobacteria bacterium]MDE2161832.1 LysR family transcriptional regulator [Alphaproteobacteria bacterium]MDE2265662.1 LysR family transcriptional regulator [Alphaproteobacteria bacterium]MDE2499767.1 LysR family transcriptional regulator [Alphaproteobacteria bacterium]
MQTPGERRVLRSEHVVKAHSKALLDWESAHLFLELVRRGSFRATADHIGLSVNALRRRIGEFEHALGMTLITRHVDGIRLTGEGDKIFAAVNQMEQAAFALVQARDMTDRSIAGEVRLAVTEGLGTFWIAPHLVEFQRANPKLLLDVNCAMHSADVLRLEADISVQLTRPTAKELRVVKLGRLHLIPFASQSYLDTYGVPNDIAEYGNHRIVVQSDEQALWEQLYNRVFPGVRPEGFVTLRTNVSSAHYWSIVKGAGIGMLPTYVHAIGAPIVPVDLGLHVPIDIWMTYHAGAARIPRVRRLVDWLIGAFSPKRFPWFRDDFLSPDELERDYKGKPLVNPFAGFAGAERDIG